MSNAKKKKKLTPKQVYLKAAELVASGAVTHCCLAIGYVVKEDWSSVTRLRAAFWGELFQPHANEKVSVWEQGYQYADRENWPSTQKLRDHRVLALCLMAAMQQE